MANDMVDLLTAEADMKDLATPPGVWEAVELYEAAMVQYAAVVAYDPAQQVARVSATSSTVVFG